MVFFKDAVRTWLRCLFSGLEYVRLCSDPVNEAEDTSVDPWLVSLFTPLPPAGDACGRNQDYITSGDACVKNQDYITAGVACYNT